MQLTPQPLPMLGCSTCALACSTLSVGALLDLHARLGVPKPQAMTSAGAGVSQAELSSLAKPLLEGFPGGAAPRAQPSEYVGGDHRCAHPLRAQRTSKVRPVC